MNDRNYNNPFIFGHSRASELLTDILKTSSPSHCRRVGRHWERFCQGLNELEAITDVTIRKTLLALWRDHQLRLIDQTDLTDELRRFLRNVCVGRFRDAIRQLEATAA